jgi:hypothetical protein
VELYEWNDVELFRPREGSGGDEEPGGGQRETNSELILAMNEKLEAIIKAEIGVDDGRGLPKIPLVNWAIDRVDL